jgi:UDP-glucose 4-epimerase
MTVLVTGATGALGPVVVHTLLAQGHAVRALVRTPPPPGLLPPTVALIPGDITDAASLAAAVTGCTAVVHLAALLHITNPPPSLAAAYTHINVTGTRHLVAAAHAAGVPRFIFASTIAVYGAHPGQVITEATPPHPTTLYARTKLAAEQIVRATTFAHGPGTVLRLASVYGPRVQGNYRRLLFSLARGRFLPLLFQFWRGSAARPAPHQPPNHRTLVYDRDVAAAIAGCLTHPAAPGGLFNVTDGTTHPMPAILAAICAALGRPVPRLHLPYAPLAAALTALDAVARLTGRSLPIGRATLDKYTEDIRVDGSHLMRTLGFTPAYDLTTGWQATVRQLRATRELP